MPVSRELGETVLENLTDMLNELPENTAGICHMSYGPRVDDATYCSCAIGGDDRMPHEAWIYMARLVLEHGRDILAACPGNHRSELRMMSLAIAAITSERAGRRRRLN